ncbi:MAG: CpsD/CapB family tyrosine-protein kinase [Steroidobacteraceae bacterium]
MDKIRKALDLARLERPQQPGDAPRPLEAVAPPAKRDRVGTIMYTCTRVVHALPEQLETRRIIGQSVPGPVSAAFRMLRTQVLQRMETHQWRTLAVFSASGGEGRTTTAVNLAIQLAGDHDHTVLLVDMDLRRPAIAVAFGFTPEHGIDDVLAGRANVADCLYHPEGFERLVVLPARQPVAHSSEVLATQRCRELVAELRDRYPERIIVFDLPPMLTTDDALAFAPHVECGLMVAVEGRTRREDLVRAIELLHKTPIVGTVLNRASQSQAEA